MTRSANLLAGAAFLGLLGFALPASAATILQDGNFDVPPAVNPFAEYFTGAVFGGVSNNAWTVLGNSIDLVGNYWAAPTPGGGSVDLNGGETGGISQAFSVGAGTYELSFSLSGNPDGGLGTKTVEVQVGDQDVMVPYTITAANSLGDMNYAFETLIFHSSGGGDILSFLSQDAGHYGAVVGGISIASVPEPATWIMLILGLGFTGTMLRKNRGKSIGLLPA